MSDLSILIKKYVYWVSDYIDKYFKSNIMSCNVYVNDVIYFCQNNKGGIYEQNYY